MPIIRATPEKWFLGDILAMNALHHLSDGYVPWTFWSMRPAAVASVVNDVILRNRQTVVEIGAGSSTLLLAKAVQLTGGRLFSIEHDADFADSLRRLLKLRGLDSIAKVVQVPLATLPEGFGLAAGDCQAPTTWYDLDQLDAAAPTGIDLLVVDGPPAGAQGDVLIREPAVRALRDKFAPSYSVYLDDLERPPERETLRLWEEQLGIPFTIIERIGLGVGSTDEGFAPTL